MHIHQDTLCVNTSGKQFIAIQNEIEKLIQTSGIHIGLCTLFIKHTSASLLIQENSDIAVRGDLDRWLSDLAPEQRVWEHHEEGPDDMPAHAKSALLKTSETLPIVDGKLGLGTWQAIYLVEHRTGQHRREVTVTIMGNPK